jgi:aminopeptidase N
VADVPDPTVLSLTHDEARERAELLEVERYDLDVDLTGLLEGEVWRSVSTIAFRCRTPGAATFVDAVGDLVSATLNGSPLDLAAASGGRLPLPGLAAENTLVVELEQPATGGGEGVLRSVDPSDGLVYVWTSFEPDDARRVWACFDQPDLKAPHAFTVTAPASWLVTSNGAPTEVTPAGDARVWRFPPTPPLSTYVVVVNAGPLHEIRQRRGGHDLGLYCRQSLRPVLERDAEEIFTLTEQGLAFFGERFDRPFPQERYDQVFMPNLGGAMENWGCVTYADTLLPVAPPTYGERSLFAYVLLHEMAHMWFGDLVTMRWWDDLWLNEAFASFASTWAQAASTRYDDAWATLAVDEEVRAHDMDTGPASHPIRGDVPDVASAMANFDAITYAKGQAVLAQLMHLVGEDTFAAGLAAYFREHAWGNAVLSDLTDAVGAAAGRDLTAWTTAWLDSAGTDAVSVETGETSAEETREQRGVVVVEGPDGESPRRHRLDVASYAVRGDALALVGTTAVETAGARTPVVLPEADLHLPNAGDLTFAAVRLGPEQVLLLRDRAHRLATPVDRAVAVQTLRGMVLDGLLETRDALAATLRVVGAEQSRGAVAALLVIARDLASSYTPLDQLDAAAAQVADAVRPLLDHPDHGPVARRTLAQVAHTDEDLERLDAPSQDDTELAWLVETRKARLGRYDEDAVAALQRRDPDPEAWVSALGARAARPTEEAKSEAWAAAYESRTVPVDRIGTVVRGFWLPEQSALLRPWCDRYLETVPEAAGAGMMAMLTLVAGTFPTVGDEAFLADVQALAEDERAHPLVRRILLARGDGLARMLRARSRPTRA